MSTEWGNLRRQLEDLGSGLYDVAMPGPDAARDRARQRTRRHAVGAVVGALVLVASGSVAATQVGDLGASDLQPVGPRTGEVTTTEPTETPAPSPSSDVPTDDPAQPVVTDDHLLDPAELQPMHDVGWQVVDALPDAILGYCADGIPAGELIRWFSTTEPVTGWPGEADSDAWTAAAQTVDVHDSADDAFAAFTDLRSRYDECVANEDEESDLLGHDGYDVANVGDDAYAVAIRINVNGNYGRVLEASVARTGSLVTRVIRQVADPEPGVIDPLVSDLTAAVNRLCETPVGGTCAGEPQVNRIPGVQTGTPGYLSPIDAATVLGTPGAWEAYVQGEDVGDDTYGHVCSEFDDAPDQVTFYTMGTGQADNGYIDETVLTFADKNTAVRAADQMIASFNSCDQDHLELEAISASAWAITFVDGGGGAAQWWGIAHHDTTVAMLDINVMADDGVTDEQVAELVDLASTRLADFE